MSPAVYCRCRDRSGRRPIYSSPGKSRDPAIGDNIAEKAYDLRFRASILLRSVFSPTLGLGNSCATSASRKPLRTWHCPDLPSASLQRPFRVEQNGSVFRLWHRSAPVKCAALDDTVSRAVIAEVARIAAWIRVGLHRWLSGASDRGWCRAASSSSNRYDNHGTGENSSKYHGRRPCLSRGPGVASGQVEASIFSAPTCGKSHIRRYRH